MIIRVLREPSSPNTTFGVMFIDGMFECFTLENSAKIIPAGTYPLSFYNSPHNKRVVPLLGNVMNRTMIEIHPANYPHELEGCIAVGQSIELTQLADSVLAFNSLMSKIEKQTNLTIEIEDWK